MAPADVFETLPGLQGSDIEVETTKDRSLARRCQSLQRFLLEQLHRELTQRAQPDKALTPDPSPSPSPPATPLVGAGDPAADAAAPGAELQRQADAAPSAAAPPGPATVVEELFKLTVRQRTQFLSSVHRHKPEQARAEPNLLCRGPTLKE